VPKMTAMRGAWRRSRTVPLRFRPAPELRPAGRHKQSAPAALERPGAGTEVSDFDVTETVLAVAPTGAAPGPASVPSGEEGRQCPPPRSPLPATSATGRTNWSSPAPAGQRGRLPTPGDCGTGGKAEQLGSSSPQPRSCIRRMSSASSNRGARSS
jgi:hypothetical protein